MQFDRTSAFYVAALVCAILLLGLLAWQVRTPGARPAAVTADHLGALSGGSYTDLSGEPVLLSRYAGAPLLVLSWASWAPGSDESLRELQRLAETYGITALAVNRAEQLPMVESYLSYAGIDERAAVVLDPEDYFFRTNESFDMPAVYLFDDNGARVTHGRGPDILREMDGAVADILEQAR